MHEARIEVSKKDGAGFRVRLIDVTNGESELASAEVPQEALSEGFPGIKFQGAPLTADVVKNRYARKAKLEDRKTFGEYLYRILTPANLGAEWDKLRSSTADGGESLSTLLELHADSWQILPWELLYHRGQGIHLFHDRTHSIGLRIPGGKTAPFEFSWPLRVLVVVGCDPAENIKWEQELRAIKRACRAFSLQFLLDVLLAPFTQKDVEDRIDRVKPHLFHFIGHATSEDEGSLLFYDGQKPNKWQREDIRSALTGLSPSESPRIAVINACQSAGADGTLGDSSTAAAFADIGSAAVIAMRGDILGTAACAFAETFYGALASVGLHRPDQAYCRAIRQIAQIEKNDQRVWSLPRIYFQETVGKVIPLKERYLCFDSACNDDKELEELTPFVDRELERLEICHGPRAWLSDPDPDDPVLLLMGADKDVGATWFLKALVYIASLRGYRTFYWGFPPERNFDVNRFLDMVGDTTGAARGCFCRSLTEAGVEEVHFAKFRKLCDFPDVVSMRGDEDRYRSLIEALAEGLKLTSNSGPVILAFDHIDRFTSDDWTKYVVPPLLQAVIAGDLGDNLRIVIAATSAEMESHGLKSIQAKTRDIGLLPPNRFENLVLEYFLRSLDQDELYEQRLAAAQQIGKLYRTEKERTNTKWKLCELRQAYVSMGCN